MTKEMALPEKTSLSCGRYQNYHYLCSENQHINRQDDMENLVNTIKELSAAFLQDASLQATRGNKAAGLRARKNALELIGKLKEFRKVSTEAGKA